LRPTRSETAPAIGWSSMNRNKAAVAIRFAVSRSKPDVFTRNLGR
jgi:hypothetical protein